MVGKFEFRDGVACFDAQLHPTVPEDIQDVLIITDKDILGHNYGLGMVGMSIGNTPIFAVNVPIDLLLGEGMVKLSKTQFFDELKKQTDLFIKEHRGALGEGA